MRFNQSLTHSLIQTGLLVALVSATTSTWADRAVKLTQEGNQQYAEEKYDAAVRKYEEALIYAPEAQELQYNIGAARLREEDFEKATEQFRKIDPLKDPALYAKAQYNLGVMRYRQAQAKVGEEAYEDALQLLKESMNANRDAIRADRSDEDAKFNYLLAKRKHQEVQQLLQQQPQPQQQNQEQNQEPDDNPEQQEQQQPQPDEPQDPPDEQPQQEQPQPNGEPEQQDEQQPSGQAPPPDNPEPQEDMDDRPPPDEMTEEDARALLNSVEEEDADALKKLIRIKGDPDMKKDW